MVRLKSRYVLFEVLYPQQTGASAASAASAASTASPEDIVLRGHRPAPAEVTGKVVLQEIRRSLQAHLGDYGYGKVNSLLQLKYWSNNTSTGILRCHREDVDLLLTGLFFISELGLEGVTVSPVKVSGTIKKVEQYAVRRSDRLVALLKKGRARGHARETLSLFSNNFTNVTADSQEA